MLETHFEADHSKGVNVGGIRRANGPSYLALGDGNLRCRPSNVSTSRRHESLALCVGKDTKTEVGDDHVLFVVEQNVWLGMTCVSQTVEMMVERLNAPRASRRG